MAIERHPLLAGRQGGLLKRLEYLGFYLWVGITAWFVIMVFADHFFGNRATRKRTALRFFLVMLWPLAILSRRGRDIVFKEGETF